MSFGTQLFRGRITGIRTSNDRSSACFKRPSDRINPSSSNFGCSPILSVDWQRLTMLQSNPFFFKLRPCSCLMSWISIAFYSSLDSSPLVRSLLILWQLCMNRKIQARILFKRNQLELRLMSRGNTFCNSRIHKHNTRDFIMMGIRYVISCLWYASVLVCCWPL